MSVRPSIDPARLLVEQLAQASLSCGQHPTLLRPMLPCFRDAFAALEHWTKNGNQPPTSRLVPRQPSADLVNTCDL